MEHPGPYEKASFLRCFCGPAAGTAPPSATAAAAAAAFRRLRAAREGVPPAMSCRASRRESSPAGVSMLVPPVPLTSGGPSAPLATSSASCALRFFPFFPSFPVFPFFPFFTFFTFVRPPSFNSSSSAAAASSSAPSSSASSTSGAGRSPATTGSARSSASRFAASSAARLRASAAALAASGSPPSISSPNRRWVLLALVCCFSHSLPRVLAWLRPQTFHTAKLSARKASSTARSSSRKAARRAVSPMLQRQTAAQTHPPMWCGPRPPSMPLKARVSRSRSFGAMAEVGVKAASRTRAVRASRASAPKRSGWPKSLGRPPLSGCTASAGKRISVARICDPADGRGRSFATSVPLAASPRPPTSPLAGSSACRPPWRSPGCLRRPAGPPTSSRARSVGHTRWCSLLSCSPKTLKTCPAASFNLARSLRQASRNLATMACCGAGALRLRQAAKSSSASAEASCGSSASPSATRCAR
mmetsp:Transcript_7897/g.24006  ORF Transcript_7897/g.24006 Transcript_7897/m.24006 type:complete len:474 (+) Transcript_7897:1-1422(+)